MATRKLYKVTRENRKDEKFAPQAQTILETIKANGEPMDRDSIVTTLDKSGALNTRQGSRRVFSFFRPKLVSAGILKEIKEEVVETAVTEKPAKAAASEKKAKVPAATKRTRTKSAGGKGKKTEVS